jgi:hypothetical protein
MLTLLFLPARRPLKAQVATRQLSVEAELTLKMALVV